MLRLFVALPLPEKARRDVTALQRQLDGLKIARNLHLTLRFIGNADCAQPFASALNMVRHKPFTLRLTLTGLFRGNILWLGPAICPPLSELKFRVDAALANAGLKAEKRAFRPHVTVARLGSGASAALIKTFETLKIDISWQVEEFCLYRSILRQQGALHEEIARYGLA